MHSNNLYLSHHGIKGQKWGVRRYQNEDGSLTDEGRKHLYGDNSKISKHKQMLVSDYMAKGMSYEEATSKADKRVNIEKTIAICAGVTLAAAAAYYVYNQNFVDRELNGVQFKKVLAGNVSDLTNDPMYIAYGKDADTYVGLYGKSLRDRGFKVSQAAINIPGGVKVASNYNAKKVFDELRVNDPEFKAYSDKMIKRGRHINDLLGKLGVGPLKTNYSTFNQMLASRSSESNYAKNKFYNKLKEKGYDAISDLNDKRYSGYGTKDPLIYFGEGRKQYAIKDLKDSEILKKSIPARLKINAKQIGTVAAVAGTASALSNRNEKVKAVRKYRLENPNSNKTNKEIYKQHKQEQLYLYKYRIEHPNSKLKDNEILKLYKEET